MERPAQGAPFKVHPPLSAQVGNGKKLQFHTFLPLLNSHHGAFSTGTSLTEVGTLTGSTKDMTAGLYVCR